MKTIDFNNSLIKLMFYCKEKKERKKIAFKSWHWVITVPKPKTLLKVNLTKTIFVNLKPEYNPQKIFFNNQNLQP